MSDLLRNSDSLLLRFRRQRGEALCLKQLEGLFNHRNGKDCDEVLKDGGWKWFTAVENKVIQRKGHDGKEQTNRQISLMKSILEPADQTGGNDQEGRGYQKQENKLAGLNFTYKGESGTKLETVKDGTCGKRKWHQGVCIFKSIGCSHSRVFLSGVLVGFLILWVLIARIFKEMR